MKLLLDTNVLIDHLAHRNPYYKPVEQLCAASYFGDVELWASVQSYLDALYALRKFAPEEALRKAAMGTLEFIHPCGMRAGDLVLALKSEWPDAEDFMIAQSAQNAAADYLITRDTKGFTGSKIPTITPDKAVALLREKGSEYALLDLGE